MKGLLNQIENSSNVKIIIIKLDYMASEEISLKKNLRVYLLETI